MPRALKKLEKHFGKIPDEKKPMILSLSKRELLARQLLERLVVQKEFREDGERLHFYIPKTKSENIVDSLVKPYFKNRTLCYEIELFSLGTLSKKTYEGVNRLAPNKRQGLGSILMKVIIEHAKRNGAKLITLNCEKEEIPFYEYFGFKALPNNGLRYEETMILEL